MVCYVKKFFDLNLFKSPVVFRKYCLFSSPLGKSFECLKTLLFVINLIDESTSFIVTKIL